MDEPSKEIEDEISDLKQELEHFQQEKERVRAIVGKIGGVPTFNTKLANWIFIVVIVITLAISIIGGKGYQLLMIEIATVALSAKIIYMIHCQMKINHFKLWMLSSIEWRLNEIMKHVRKFKDSD
jgi:hypothetical protein